MYDRPHFMFTFGGTVLKGAEIWQTGLRYAPQEGQTDTEDLVDALGHISVEDCFNAMSEVIANQVTGMQYGDNVEATFAKVAVLGMDGHYVTAPKIHEGSVKGKLALSAGHPPQSAWVATLGTGKKFGMAQKGRMYWPLPGQAAGNLDLQTGQIPASLCNSMRDLVNAAIEAVEGELTTVNSAVAAAVMSLNGGRTAPQAPGTTNYVTEVSVGRIVDTQRRRRSALQEAYNPAPNARGRRLIEEREARSASATAGSRSSEPPSGGRRGTPRVQGS